MVRRVGAKPPACHVIPQLKWLTSKKEENGPIRFGLRTDTLLLPLIIEQEPKRIVTQSELAMRPAQTFCQGQNSNAAQGLLGTALKATSSQEGTCHSRRVCQHNQIDAHVAKNKPNVLHADKIGAYSID